jgi:uncharacterized protein YndB with AHSA1/START domain
MTLDVKTQGEREVVMTRVFDAPRRMVFEAFSKPELMKKWFGPRGWTLPVCEMDARVGGGFRFVMRGPDGREMGLRGRYVEMEAPARSVHMEAFDDFPGESRVTGEFVEQDGRTTLTVTVEYPSQEARDAVLQMGMPRGAGESYDKLAEMLDRTLRMRAEGETGIVARRNFAAPPEMVFRAYTEPELVRRWLGVWNGWHMSECEIDLRVGGRYRYEWRHEAKGQQMAVGGSFREIVRPERLGTTEQFEDPWYEGECVVLTEFAAAGDGTRMTMTMTFVSAAVRDGAMKSGMDRGMEGSYQMLERLAEEGWK